MYCLENVYFRRFICLDNFISIIFVAEIQQITKFYVLQENIEKYLSEWASRETRKPILLRGALKSSAVRHEAMPSVLLRLSVFSCLQL